MYRRLRLNGRRLRLDGRRWLIARSLRTLEGANGLLEGQTMRPQQVCSDGLAVADDGSQHDRAVDLAPLALCGRGGRCFENAPHVRRDEQVGVRASRSLLDPAQVLRDVAFEPGHVDAAGRQNHQRFGIGGECQQQMLECHLDMRLRAGVVARPGQSGSEVLR